MVEFKYGFNKKLPEGAKTAKAQGYDIEASYKDLSQVCADVRGTLAEPALTHLELASKRKVAIPFARFNKRMGHRHELGGRKGRFPWKAANCVRMILENAIANSRSLGIQTPYILHAAANKQRTLPRIASKGRRFRSDYETARIEIVLTEAPFERSESAKNINKGARELTVKMQAQKLAKKQEKNEQKVKATV